MAKVLNFESEIANGLTIEPEHVKQSVDAFTGAEAYDITISGSLVTTGSIKGTTTLTIGNGHTNTSNFSTIAGGTLNIASAACSFIGGGENNSITGCSLGNIVGGQNNTISGGYNGFIGAGCDNTLSAGYGCENVIVGGCNNDITAACGAEYNFIGGGSNNTISGVYTTDSGILGGTNNCIDSHDNSFIIGSNLTSAANCTTYVNNLDISGSATGTKLTIGSSHTNTGILSTIAGGTTNIASAACSFIGGGENNSITGCSLGNIVGGQNNTISGGYNGFIGAGCDNTLSAGYGCENVIVGGCNNDITAACDAERNFIGGGSNNTISGDFTSHSGILGGTSNCIDGHANSFIIGSDITSTASCTTYVNNIHVTGSTTTNAILQLSRRETTPTGTEGMIIASGSAGASKLYYYNGSTWNALF